MPKNSFLEKQRALNQGFWEDGIECGFQKAVDLFSVALNDPEIMGKDTFGKKRLFALLRGVAEYDHHFSLAYSVDVEADYRQEELDAALRRIYGESFQPFADRYPYIKIPGYKKSLKGWK